jgi:hypothetical protein
MVAPPHPEWEFFISHGTERMVFTVRLVSHSVPRHRDAILPGNIIQRWRGYYRPPWPFLLHLTLVIIIFICFSEVFYPSVTALFDVRLMLITLMYAGVPDDVPFSAMGDLQNSIDNYLDAIENLSANSLLDFYFTDPDHPINCSILWRNGSTTFGPVLSINLSYLDHITEFRISSDFMLASTDSDLLGCTRWGSSFIIRLRTASYLFSISSVLTRSSCPKFVMGPDTGVARAQAIESILGRVLSEKSERLDFARKPRQERLRNRQGGFLYRRIDAPTQVDPPTFSRAHLTLYGPMARFGMIILSLSTVLFVLSLMSLGRAFVLHTDLIVSDADYIEQGAYNQFHSVIGFWTPITLVTSLALVIAGSCMVYDVDQITQFPSQANCVTFGVAALFTLATAAKYLKQIPHSYAVVLVMRQAIGRFLILLLSIMPFIAALVYVGVFLFGLVSVHSLSFLSLLRVLISITFGDNILPTYAEFSDSSDTYNWLSTIYVSVLTALAMWIFFTLFTAETVHIFEAHVMPAVGPINH